MRTAFALLAVPLSLAFAPGSALAQTSGWGGYYLGASASWTGGRNGEIDATIDPFRDARFDYTRNAGRPPRTSTFQRERNIEGAGGFDGRAGRLFERGDWVWGIEVQSGGAALDERFSIGPIDADPLAYGPGGELAYVFGSNDTLAADLDIGVQTSVRARIGRPISDRVLLSAFAGPSVLRADLKLRQDSTVQYAALRFTTVLPGRPYTVPYLVDQSVAGEESGHVTGGTIGAAVDVKLTERWLVHAEGNLSRYGAIEAQTPAYAGSGSRFSYAPTLYSVSLGLAYRF
ncbi:outer membrane protein [Brevundimonas sp. R86498]|uniref:outer membrane protein n=1 Tax=Brevundimonas sp. R86498 TaxID=3093845 RepID=UPI0037C6D5C5